MSTSRRKLIWSVLLAILGGALFVLRNVTFYSYPVQRPTDVHYLHSPKAFGIAGFAFITAAVILAVTSATKNASR